MAGRADCLIGEPLSLMSRRRESLFRSWAKPSRRGITTPGNPMNRAVRTFGRGMPLKRF
jgi:hypothetical protein